MRAIPNKRHTVEKWGGIAIHIVACLTIYMPASQPVSLPACASAKDRCFQRASSHTSSVFELFPKTLQAGCKSTRNSKAIRGPKNDSAK